MAATLKDKQAAQRRVLFDRLIELVSDGASVRGACKLTGVPFSTLQGWVRKYKTYADDYNRALTEREGARKEYAEELIAMHDDWRARAHYLARKYPAEWGKREDAPAAAGGNIVVHIAGVTREDLPLSEAERIARDAEVNASIWAERKEASGADTD